MVWAGVTANLKTQLSIINGNLNAQCNVEEILQPVVIPFLGQIQQGAVFQDDNTRPYHGKVVNNFKRQQNIQRLNWTANLPDLNPIEHIWDEVGMAVYRLKPPQMLAHLRQRLVYEWANIPQHVIRKCVQSMRRQCQACINARGGQTGY